MAVLDRQNIRVEVQRNAREAHSLANTIKGTVGLKGPGRRHAGLRPPPEPNIGFKRGYMLGDRRKTTKKLKPNSLQSPNRLPPHKRLMGWQGEGLASGPYSGWPRVRGLLGWPRLPRIPSVVEPPLVSVGLPRGRQAGVAPAIHTGVRGWAQQGRGPESSMLSCVAGWPRKT
jgi:hypothetical protein